MNGECSGGNELVNWCTLRREPAEIDDIKWLFVWFTSEFVRQDCGSSRFRRRFLGDGDVVGGGISKCVLNSCCADCWSNCVMLLTSWPSLVEHLSVVDGEIVPIRMCDGVGEELCETGDGLLNTFRLISVGEAVCGAWTGDVDGDVGTWSAVPEPSDTARPSNWIDSVAVVTVMVSKTFCKTKERERD